MEIFRREAVPDQEPVRDSASLSCYLNESFIKEGE